MKFSMSDCGGNNTTPPPPSGLNGLASPDNNGLSTIGVLDQSSSVQQMGSSVVSSVVSAVVSEDNGNLGFCELGAKRLKTSTSLNNINTIGTTVNSNNNR